jgi:hypothetical protein
MADEKGVTTVSEDAAPAKCPSERPGIKTTEFWLAVAMILAGVWLISKGKDEIGAALIGIAGTVYPALRGAVKSKLAQVAGVLALVVLLSGCGTPGYVKASEVQELTRAICDRHDRLVKATKDYPEGEQKRQSDLRSSAILRGTIDEAVRAGQGKEGHQNAGASPAKE